MSGHYFHDGRPAMNYESVAGADDLAEGEMRAVKAGGKDVLLANVAGEFYAVDGVCSHALGYLDEGVLAGYTIHCPLHRGSFDIRTGAPLSAPAKEPLRCYPVKVEAANVFVATE
jgi:nitrite reductase/ring-hydroxylating ferredoxin subunit